MTKSQKGAFWDWNRLQHDTSDKNVAENISYTGFYMVFIVVVVFSNKWSAGMQQKTICLSTVCFKVNSADNSIAGSDTYPWWLWL